MPDRQEIIINSYPAFFKSDPLPRKLGVSPKGAPKSPKGDLLINKNLWNPPLGDRALKNCPVDNFSEGASLQGRIVVGAGGKEREWCKNQDFGYSLRIAIRNEWGPDKILENQKLLEK